MVSQSVEHITPTHRVKGVNDVFRDLLDVSVLVYLDDILVFSEAADLHEHHVR